MPAGSLTLFSGDPGIGKSTMLLQLADLMAATSSEAMAGAEPGSPMRESDAVLYVTAEESVDQVSPLCQGLCSKTSLSRLFL